MINKTNGAWILVRNTHDFLYGDVKKQFTAAKSELLSEGYVHTGTSRLRSSFMRSRGDAPIADMLRAAVQGDISALFLFRIRCISDNLYEAFGLIDRLNDMGVIVYENEGCQYSYNWYCRQIGRKIRE